MPANWEINSCLKKPIRFNELLEYVWNTFGYLLIIVDLPRWNDYFFGPHYRLRTEIWLVMKILIKVAILLVVVLGGGAIYGWLQWEPIAAELSAKDQEKFDLMIGEAKSFGFGTAQKIYDELDSMTPEDVVNSRHSKWQKKLETDEEYLETIARERFLMVKEGEKVFRVIDTKQIK